jgi:hypothetical protein
MTSSPLPNTLPFGLRDVVIYPLDSSGARGTGVDLPVSKTFSFKETYQNAELIGDDRYVASHSYNPLVEWELEAGGISLTAYAVLVGGTLTQTGTGSAEVQTFEKLVTDDRPYFEVEGQAISDSGGDVHLVVYRCKVTGDIDGKMDNGTFWMSKTSGKGYGRLDNNKLYDIIQNVTITAITD